MLKVRRDEDAVIPVQMDLTPIDGWEDIDFAIRRGRLTGKQVADKILSAYRHRKKIDSAEDAPEEIEPKLPADPETGNTSNFELTEVKESGLDDFGPDDLAENFKIIAGLDSNKCGESTIVKELMKRKFLKTRGKSRTCATALGIMMFGDDPTRFFPQCRLIAEYYKGDDAVGKPLGYMDIRASVPQTIEEVSSFLLKYMDSTFRIVDMDRVRIDEYPEDAYREAIVNALAHRDYSRTGETIFVRLLKGNRLVISSPGLLPSPLTIPNLLKGDYPPISRNPYLADNLNRLNKMEGRGKGVALMTSAMVNHGLKPPRFKKAQGKRFEVTLLSPGDRLASLKPSTVHKVWAIDTFTKTQLSDRQKKVVTQVQKNGSVTSRWCQDKFKISRETANHDLSELIDLKIVKRVGKGKATRYELFSDSSDLRQVK